MPADHSHPRDGLRVGLVLGGGGVLGAAWLIGAMQALVEQTGWEPKTADYIVGTSAGSAVGALVASGMPPWFLVYHQRGGPTEGMTDRYGKPMLGARETTPGLFKLTRNLPRLALGSPQLAMRTSLRPWRYPPAAALTGWLGRGFMSTDQVGRVVRSVVAEGWSDHPNLWIVAMDYSTGRRVVFGRDGAPAADLWRAVEASCAIPGMYAPVRIGGRTYVDGGAWSPSNLDLLSREDLDVVIVLNPTSSLNPGPPTTVLERVERRVRAASGRRLSREARKVEESGARVLLVQPGAEDLAAMGINLMNPSRRTIVLETALRTTTARLLEDDALDVLAKLPAAGQGTAPAGANN
ncbi:MAG TPA: patatin-like phospholipase family protein [Actinomycetota bacterium]|nr:patatin-like phospholipase family protein [Actinomycetota bacterium]